MSIINENDIARCVRKAVEDYFNDLDGEKPHAIHDMVIRSVEKPLIELVMGGADCSRKNASCTTSSARERQPVIRAAIFTRISRLSTNA